MTKERAMQVIQLSVRLLHANPWNVNRMSKAMTRKLTAYLKREGLVEPIVVRPHPSKEGSYEILGGYHRWSICKDELSYETIPCVVVEGLDDKRAKILSLNLNSMSGEAVPSLLSSLLSDLNQDLPLADLEATLPWEQGEIKDMMSLMQVPQGFGEELEQEAEEQDSLAPVVLTLVLDPELEKLWIQACEQVELSLGRIRNPKVEALRAVVSHFLGTNGHHTGGSA